jgi:hypothetical protein
MPSNLKLLVEGSWMSLIEMLSAIRSLPRADRVRLVHLLIEDLTQESPELLSLNASQQEVWIPEDNSEGAAVLQRLLDAERVAQ